jgi:hypothetical protein
MSPYKNIIDFFKQYLLSYLRKLSLLRNLSAQLGDVFLNAANYCHWIANINNTELFRIRDLNQESLFELHYPGQKKSDKFSVIIPTMWKSERTLNLLEELNSCDLIEEIIIIDNCFYNRPQFNLKKCKLITQKNNIYVNPAWNLGVNLAKNNLIAICNDDIHFDVKSTFDFISRNTSFLGCIGIHPQSYQAESDGFSLETGYDTDKGWGCLMFCKKENWIEIPGNLKIGYGDDWLALTNRPHYSLVCKTKIETEMSTTSKRNEFRPIISSDIQTWKRIFHT